MPRSGFWPEERLEGVEGEKPGKVADSSGSGSSPGSVPEHASPFESNFSVKQVHRALALCLQERIETLFLSLFTCKVVFTVSMGMMNILHAAETMEAAAV